MKQIELNEYCPCCGYDTFDEFGACEKDMIKNVQKPSKTAKINPKWIGIK